MFTTLTPGGAVLGRKMSKIVGAFRRGLSRASLALRRHVVVAARDAGRRRAEEDVRAQPARARVRAQGQALQRLFPPHDDQRHHHERGCEVC